MQIWLRRILISYKRQKYDDIWPIDFNSAKKPAGWKGWPENKDFAIVLTHDVELQKGHDVSVKLMRIEKELGFKSSFNFVPERYIVSEKVRSELCENGFEVGVHGLNHDGKLFSSREEFDKRALKINKYIKDWNAKGFRAPAMHHNLEWISELDIKYDLSTFDTDPFEPQSDGVGTIFPFYYKSQITGREYLEMPYTLPQDFTTFVLIGEKSADIWVKKLEWLVANNAMVLVNVHPDYICFEGDKKGVEQFPVKIYIDFLRYVKNNYKDKYWNPLPDELAEFWKENFNNKN